MYHKFGLQYYPLSVFLYCKFWGLLRFYFAGTLNYNNKAQLPGKDKIHTSYLKDSDCPFEEKVTWVK